MNGAALYIFIMMAIHDRTNAGSIVLYISLLPQFIGGLQMLINAVAQTRDNNFYIKHFFDFLEREEEIVSGQKLLEIKQLCLEMKNVFSGIRVQIEML